MTITVRLDTNTPCCHRPVRLTATRTVPREAYDRTCPACGLHYVITRTTLIERSGGRVDKLEWD